MTPNTQHPTPDPSAAPAFLELIPARLRGSVTNAFLHGPRRNVSDPNVITAAARREFQQKLARARTPEDAEKYDAVVSAINSQIALALEFAEWCIAYHNMPDAARQERKQERAAPYVAKWMQGQEPTAKQLACLERLGFRGEVSDQAEAARLIDGLLNESEAVR